MAEKMANIRGTAFGRVLSRLMESRGLNADRKSVEELADLGGLRAADLLARMAGELPALAGPLCDVAYALDLDEREMEILALAYALEREPVSEDRLTE